jgi:hypothetical protein
MDIARISPRDKNMNTIKLKDLVQDIRRQLEELDRERTSQELEALFELQGMDIELKFTVAESATAKGGFDIKIVTAGGEGHEHSEAVQTIKISYRVSPQYEGFGKRAHHSSQHSTAKEEGVKPLP